MEENNENNPVENPTPGRVIDVQVHEQFIPTVEAAGDPPEDQTVPVTETPALSEEPSEPSPEMPTEEAHEPDTKPPHDEHPAPAAHKPGAPVVAIIAAVLVAIGLIAVTVYAYQKSQDGNKTDKYSLPSTNSETQADTATKEVDDVSKAVDSASNSADETDFSESELTDQNLGL
jgi:uncharacterized protein HemX